MLQASVAVYKRGGEMKSYRLLVLSVALLLSVFGQGPAQKVSGQQADCQTFPETGNTVCGRFLTYWQGHGGLPQQGYPISGVFQEVSETDGKSYTVQYFERAIFELHPENAPPNDVLLSLLGVFLYKQKYPSEAPGQEANNSAGSVLFPETGKRVGGIFLDYWKAHGGLAQQGLPISDEFVETSDLDGKPYRVQYFERAVFEYHPEQQAAYQVLLSQLGAFRYRAKYSASAPPTVAPPAAQPTQQPAPTQPAEGNGNPPLSCASPPGQYCAAATVSDANPRPRGSVRVTGRLMQGGNPVSGATMNTVWRYKTKDTPCDGAKTDAAGYAGCTNSIGSPTPRYEVRISVMFYVNGQEVASTETSFVPQ